MIHFLRYLLFPITLIYAAITWCRNKLYDFNILKSHSFSIPIISVGNLMVGGTGKTPVTEYLVQLFPDKRLAILSRGYGRKTSGFILANQYSTAETIGDEPMQYFTKFKNVTVAVCEDRVVGIQNLQATHDLILLDDAFQHRAVNPGLKILLFDYQSLQTPQFPFPTGNMREIWSGYKRADLILVTKTPVELMESKKLLLKKKFPEKEVFISRLSYGKLTKFDASEILENLNKNLKVIVLTGIAKPTPLIQYLKSIVTIVKHFDFPDHYQFQEKDFKEIVAYYNKLNDSNVILITTEKDLQRINATNFSEILVTLPLYYLPVSIDFSGDQNLFNNRILQYVTNT